MTDYAEAELRTEISNFLFADDALGAHTLRYLARIIREDIASA
jgi:hypothetical protein